MNGIIDLRKQPGKPAIRPGNGTHKGVKALEKSILKGNKLIVMNATIDLRKAPVYKVEKHNPYCKLVGVTINNREFVYGITNEGTNPGLEVYYKQPGEIHHYYSKRFAYPDIPMIYNELYFKLKGLADNCKPGHKLTLTLNQYQNL